jgi:hypothetical protein
MSGQTRLSALWQPPPQASSIATTGKGKGPREREVVRRQAPRKPKAANHCAIAPAPIEIQRGLSCHEGQRAVEGSPFWLGWEAWCGPARRRQHYVLLGQPTITDAARGRPDARRSATAYPRSVLTAEEDAWAIHLSETR